MTTELRQIYSGPIRRAFDRIDRNIGDVNGMSLVDRIVALEASTTPTPWTSVTFQNGWENYGAGHQQLHYRKVGDVVTVSGTVTGGTVGAVVCILPVGFRPPATFQITVAGPSGDDCLVNVYSNGDLQVGVSDSGNAAVSIQLSFSVTP